MQDINPDQLRVRLVEALGAEAVSDSPDLRAFVANDVYRGGGLPALVVRPATVESLQEAVRICAAAGVAMVPRGGGASYTDAYLYPPGGHVLFDTAGLDTIEVDSKNMVVTVGAGVTWAALKARLAEDGLRTPFWGPFSGLAATVGGSVSQNSLSHGSASYGISAESVLSMDVVLASGDLMRTSASSATRHYGPDLTGLFTGDCGALGIKASIRLPLFAVRTHFQAITFAFPDFAAYHGGVRAAQRERLDESHFGLDIALSQGQIGKQEGVTARMRIAREVMRAAAGPLTGIRQLIRMAVSGDQAMRAGAYMAHFIVEGIDATEAAAKAKRLRAVLAPFGAESANSVPTFVRAIPFAPLTNILGPSGERWIPLHGVLQHSQAVPFNDALTALFAARKSEMDRLGVWNGTMFSPVGPSGFLYEVALYWPDARTAYHDTVLDPDHLAGLAVHPANADAKAYVALLKQDIIALYQQFGAAHFQIGRAYPYRARLDGAADGLLRAIKATLDPKGLMNPGALGLGGGNG